MKKSPNKKASIDEKEKKLKEDLCTDFMSRIYWHLNHISSREKSILEFICTVSVSVVTTIITVIIFKKS